MTVDMELHDSFVRIESKYAGLPSSQAAGADVTSARISRLKQLAASPGGQEFHCPMKNDWEKIAFHALLNRYGVRAYRYRKQRQSTVLVHVNKAFMDNVLWPIFQDLSVELQMRFTQVTEALLPAIAPGPYHLAVLPHDHAEGRLCEDCQRRLLSEKQIGNAVP